MDQPRLPPPRAAVALGAVAATLLALPLLGLLVRGGSRVGDALASEAIRQALLVTARTSLPAAAIATVLGVALALVAERGRGWVAGAAGLLGEVPLVVPPVVSGLGLLLVLGREGLLGGALDVVGLVPTFRAGAVMIVQVVVALPMVVLAVRAGLSTLDPLPEQVAAVHGEGPLRRTLSTTLPALRGPVLLGAGLGWGRAVGEFGATLVFAGSLPGRTRTLPLQVFSDLQADPGLAAGAALVLVATSVAAFVLARRIGR